MITVSIIPALKDNYIYLLAGDGRAVVIDPGDATPVQAALAHEGLSLEAIVITHRHSDHIGGVATLMAHHFGTTIYAPTGCGLSAHFCDDGDVITLLDGALTLKTIATPGHTKEHLSYVGNGMAFCGDTVFACGCGRVSEMTLAQMYESVSRLAALPDDTLLYCGHEYTANNIRFARAVEPSNSILQQRQVDTENKRKQNLPTVPFTVADEKASNPFFRLREPEVIHAAQQYVGKTLNSDAAVFGALRCWKDSY